MIQLQIKNFQETSGRLVLRNVRSCPRPWQASSIKNPSAMPCPCILFTNHTLWPVWANSQDPARLSGFFFGVISDLAYEHAAKPPLKRSRPILLTWLAGLLSPCFLRRQVELTSESCSHDMGIDVAPDVASRLGAAGKMLS